MPSIAIAWRRTGADASSGARATARSADSSASAQSPATTAITAASACSSAAAAGIVPAIRSASSVSDAWLENASRIPPLSVTSASRWCTAARSAGCSTVATDSSSAAARR